MSKAYEIRVGRLYTPEKLISPARIVVRDGWVEAVLRADCPEVDGMPVVRLDRLWAGPGLIDLHTHGAEGFAAGSLQPEDYAGWSRALAQKGVTAFLPTFMSYGPAELFPRLEAFKEAFGREDGAKILGLHLEGPFLSPCFAGSHDPGSLFNPSGPLVRRIIEEGAGLIRLVTIAPELPGAPEAVQAMVQAGVAVSLGHSGADYAAVAEAARRGASRVTHLFNAMGPFHHREPRLAAWALAEREVWAEFIADGLHLHPEVVRLVASVKGDRAVLVSDSLPPCGLGNGVYQSGGQKVVILGGEARTPEGKLAGGLLDLWEAVKNLVRWADLDIGKALATASLAPAESLGIDALGRIEPGVPANLVFFDDGMNLKGTLVREKTFPEGLFGEDLP